MEEKISPDENLYRAVPMNPNFWKTNQQRPSSALFESNIGVSVDRDGKRDDKIITESFLERFGECNIKAVVFVNAGVCMDIGTYIKYLPKPDNEYHSEIHESESVIEIKSSKAKKIASNCTVVYMNEAI